jgi:8-amino-7-oxononanoate synthase
MQTPSDTYQKALGRIEDALQSRQENGRLRTLRQLQLPVDFSSNDYLGLSRSAWMKQRTDRQAEALDLGATGSRLLNGNTPFAEELEKNIADFFGSEAALIFNSGFDANTGLLSTVIRKGDTVFYDQAIHASMHQGLQLSGATLVAFQHNCLEDLLQQIKSTDLTSGQSWLVCESYYSMDGDQAPLHEFALICKRYGLELIVDEAHAIGCFGESGKGLSQGLRESHDVFATVITFGKALGTHGAAVLCSSRTRDYLINFCKSFIYTTALPPHSLVGIESGLAFLKKFTRPQQQLHSNIRYFQNETTDLSNICGIGPVFGYLMPGETAVKAAAAKLQAAGLDVRPIVAPTVSKGEERLRIIIHSFNTKGEIDLLNKTLRH